MCVRGTAALLKKVDAEGTQAAFQELVEYMQEQVVPDSQCLHRLASALACLSTNR